MSVTYRNPIPATLLELVAQMCTTDEDGADEIEFSDAWESAAAGAPRHCTEYLTKLADLCRVAMKDLATAAPGTVQKIGTDLLSVNICMNGTLMRVENGEITRLVLNGTGSGSVDVEAGDPAWPLTAPVREELKSYLTKSAQAV